jgi:hypothetical protein
MTRALMVLALAAALGVAGHAAPAEAAPVAFIEHVYPPTRLASVIHVERAGRRIAIAGSKLDLEPEDRISVDNPAAVVVVRYLASSATVTLGKTTGQSEYTVGASSVPGLAGDILAWLEDQLTGADRGSLLPLASRSVVVGGDTCFNLTGESDAPTRFDAPALGAAETRIVAGKRALVVSWRGGVAPFTVTLARADTGATLVESPPVYDACAANLPRARIAPGAYRLTITDAKGALLQAGSVLAAAEPPPPMPVQLRTAALPDDAKRLYYATWLAAQGGGEWAFEAQQQVATLRCTSPGVRDWLSQWGDPTTCRGD